MSDPGKAVFLSYASQDAAAVERVATALRAAGVEVWFDKNELVGGDAWDAKIRKQIAECALFVPIISASTQARLEGYFRIEWKLAARRTHAMAAAKAFLLPVVIDDTHDADAHVPDEFREVQWTRLPGGDTPEKFCARVQRLLEGAGRDARSPAGASLGDARGRRQAAPPQKPSRRWRVPAALVGVGAIALIFWQPWNKPGLESANHPRGVSVAEKSAPPAAVPLPEARRLVAQARALIDEDPMRVRENFHTADELCGRAATLSPDDAEVWATWARTTCVLISDYNEKGDKQTAAARSRAERAIRLAPDSIESGLAMANFDAVSGAGDQAATQRLLALLPRAPTDRRIPRLLATIAGDIVGKIDDARRWAEQADALPGGDSQALEQLAWGYWGQNRLPEMEAVLDRIFSRQPTSVAYHLRLMALWAWGDLDGVLAWLEKTPPAVLAEDRVVSIAVDTYQMKGRPEKALALLSRIPREFLEEGRYLAPKSFLVGEVLQAMGKPRAAEVEFRSALKSVDDRIAANPHDGFLFGWKGRVLVKLGDQAEADRQFETGRELGASSTVRVSAADEVLLGRYDAALAEIDRRLDRKQTRWPSFLTQLKYGSEYNPLRGDPRFQALLARAQAWLDEMRAAPAATAKPGATDYSAAADKSVAVLAFDNRSDDKEAEYFSDGVSEELINALGRVPGLTVKGRTSAFFFKGKNATAQEIAEKLGVNYLVRGSVRKAGGKVRITAQLSRAATDEIVWSSETLEREVKDVFAVQDEIVGLIAKSLSVQMGVPLRASHQVNPDALTALLQGRQIWVQRTAEGFARARELFNRAVGLDPEWAVAHAALASLEAIEASFLRGGGGSVDARLALATREAKRALELDATLGEPHATLGKIAMEYRRHGEADQEFRRALALEPNNALVHDWYGDFSVTQGRLDLAMAEYRRAMELEPLSPYIMFDLAWELMNVRRYGDALALVERAATLTPSGTARYTLRRARLLLELGRNSEAEAALRAYLESPMSGSDPQFINEAAWCLRAFDSTADRERLTTELLRKFPDTYASGVILLMLGQHEKAFPLLERVPPIFLQQIYWESVFDPVRDTPRFRTLLEKLGCVEQYQVARDTLARMLKEPAAKQ